MFYKNFDESFTASYHHFLKKYTDYFAQSERLVNYVDIIIEITKVNLPYISMTLE